MGRWVRARVRPGIWIALSMGFAGATVSGCLIDIEPAIACGDGFVDRAAGEACDPNADQSLWLTDCETQRDFVDKACDPSACVIDDEAEERACAVCGNGILEEGEECDGTQFSEICYQPGGELICRGPSAAAPCTIDYVNCHCGNGVVDTEFGEECEWRYPCDPNQDDSFFCPSVGGVCSEEERCVVTPNIIGSAAGSQACTDLDDGVNWGGGTLKQLTDCDRTTCSWITSRCTLCGNGVLNDDEECDGEAADLSVKQDRCAMACTGGPVGTQLDCDLPCSSTCSYENDPNVIVGDPSLGCCIIREANCTPGSDLECCAGLTCRTFDIGGQLVGRCQP